jgi:hypothetical protein
MKRFGRALAPLLSLSLALAVAAQPPAEAAGRRAKHHSHKAEVATARAASTSWNTVWQDDFTGPAGQAPNPANWFHDTGYGWTAGEVETYTDSTTNASLDGAGDLRITPVRDAAGNWTSARRRE